MENRSFISGIMIGVMVGSIFTIFLLECCRAWHIGATCECGEIKE